VKTVAVFANASSDGVRPRVDPRKPMRSARVVSSVTRRMFLLGAGGWGLAAGSTPSESASTQKGRNAFPSRPSYFRRRTSYLEQHLHRPLHRARTTGTEHRV